MYTYSHCVVTSAYYNDTRKPVVTGRKVIVFYLSLVVSFEFLLHQKISVTTKDTAELNVKHVTVKHNVITTKSIKMALVNICTCRFVYSVAIFVTMVTMQSFAF